MITWNLNRQMGTFVGIVLALALSACGSGSSSSSSGGSGTTLDSETKSNIASVLWMDKFDSNSLPPEVAYALKTATNSPAAFGTRMQNRLAALLANPDDFTPDYTTRYNTLSTSATDLSPHQSYAYDMLLGLDSSGGYQELSSDATFEFPRDDQPQFDYQTGWHFFVGSAFTDSGEEYGVQLMFWQNSLLPPQAAADAGLTPIQNQIVEIHFAISKVGDRHYRSQPYVVSGTTNLVAFSQTPFNYSIGKNFLLSQKPDTLFPLELRAKGQDNRDATAVPIEIDITLNQVKDYILEGDHGMSPSCGGVGTLYYSVPDLQVDPTTSWLSINGQKAHLSSGVFWYDHQWGTGFLPGGNTRTSAMRAFNRLTTPAPGGWDWMAIQFDDHTEIALSALHTTANMAFYQQTGDTPPGTMTADAHGLYIDESGAYNSITGHIQVTEWIRSTISYGLYMATNAWYPNKVEVTIDSTIVPENRRTFSMVPIVQTGQQGYFAFGAQYSEGAVYLETADGTKIGRGFLESTDYANNQDQILKLAGFAQTDANRELLAAPAPVTTELQTQSADYLIVPANAATLEQELAACKGL